MTTRNEVLRKGFVKAMNRMGANALESPLTEALIGTSIQAYAARRGLTFSPSEIDSVIKEGMALRKCAGEDFSYQDWTMSR